MIADLALPYNCEPIQIEALLAGVSGEAEYEIVVPPSPRLSPSPTQPRNYGHATVFQMPVDRSAAASKLDTIANLGQGWDGYEGDELSAACLARARAIIAALPAWVPSPVLFPNPNGTLTLEWESEKGELSVEVGDKAFSSVLDTGGAPRFAQGSLGEALPGAIASALTVLYDEREPLLPDRAASTTLPGWEHGVPAY